MHVELKKVIEKTSNIVFLGGAGVSTESNIPDFRSASGLYNEKTLKNYSPEEILSRSFFESNTEDFFGFYRSKMIYRDAKPNKAHLALAKLESKGKLKTIITQNIDGLHQAAGSKCVIELHGSIHRNYCVRCGKNFGVDYIAESESIVPRCDNCGGVVRPDVVLYEESLDCQVLGDAVNYISKADVLIIGGTSLVVYPAAGLIRYFRGSKLVLINKSATTYDKEADIIINENIGSVMADIVGL